MPEAHRLEGRDENGKFAKGNKGGPGRKTVVQERRLLSVLQENVSEEDWIAITKKAVTDAKDGDDRARAWLSRYVLPNINDPEKEDGVESLSDLFEVLQGDIDRMTDPAVLAGEKLTTVYKKLGLNPPSEGDQIREPGNGNRAG